MTIPSLWPGRLNPFPALFAALVVAWAALAAPASPQGLWRTAEGDARIEIRPCGQALCGEIVWLDPPDKRDEINVDPAQRDRPLLGAQILWDVRPDDEEAGLWGNGGRIYDPRIFGDDFRAELELREPDLLAVRGCTWIACSDWQMWIRVGQ